MSKKEAYIEKAKAKIDKQMAKLEELKAKARGEIAEGKIKSQQKIDELEAKMKAAKAHLTEITDSAEDTWESIKGRFDDLADDIGAALKKFFAKDEQQNQTDVSGEKDEQQ